MKKDRKRIILYVITFLIPIIVTLFNMYRKDCYPFGSQRSFLLGDADDQYIQFFRMLYDRLAEGKSFLFSWDSGMGFDFLANYFYYLANPCTWIVLLFGRQHVELGMVCSILLQMGGCGVTAMYYLNHSKINKVKDEKWNGMICLLFAITYALCDYILAYRNNLMWMMGFMIVPLLMLGVEYLVDKNDGRLYGVLLFLGFISNYYFAWFLCIWAVICFIDQKKENVQHWKRSFGKFVFTSVLSAMCASVVLVPAYLTALSRNNVDWYTLDDYGLGYHDTIGNFFNGFFWAHNLKLTGETVFTQNNYCGIFVLILGFAYLFNKKIDKLQKFKRILEMVFLSIGLNWIGLYWVLHGFTFPHSYSNRYAFMLIFLLIITAFENLNGIEGIRLRYIGLLSMVFFGMFILVIMKGGLSDSNLSYIVTMFVMVWLLLSLVLYRRNSISRSAFILNLCVIGFAEIITNISFSNADSVSRRTEAMAGTAEWMNQYDTLETKTGERKTAFFIDTDLEFAYSQTDLFASAINSELRELYGFVGLSNSNSGVSYNFLGTTPLTAALFNVRYVLTDQPERFGGYHIANDTQSNDLYETEYLVGFGFVLPETVALWDTDEKNVFEVQNNFTRDVLGKGDVFTHVQLDDFEFENVACELTTYTEEEYHYINQDASALDYASIIITGVIPEDMDLYIHTKCLRRQLSVILIDGEVFYNDNGAIEDDAHTFHIGEIKRGQTIQLYLSDLSEIQEESDFGVYFYSYHDDVMQDTLLEMKKSVFEIEDFEDTYIAGTVRNEESGILYTSIPYYRGFTVYVDGKEADIIKIGNALIGVRVPIGEHKIEFRYFTYGLKTGIVVSVVGVIILIGYMIYRKNKRTQNEN